MKVGLMAEEAPIGNDEPLTRVLLPIRDVINTAVRSRTK
jgi:hypothetical protein